MSTLQSSVTIVEDGANKYGSHSALKVRSPASEAGIQWEDISYTQLRTDIDACAHYWASEFASRGWKPNSVIGLWLKGVGYSDLVTILGISRAGFVPQLLSLRLPDPGVIIELLNEASASAVIVDPSYKSLVSACPFTVYTRAETIDMLKGDVNTSLPPPPSDPDQVIMIYHTSGTTSGKPKLVPYTARFVDHCIVKSQRARERSGSVKQQIGPACGSFCHAASYLILLITLRGGGCVVLPSSAPLSAIELRQMLFGCDLTFLPLFSSITDKIIEMAQRDELVLAKLQQLDTISASGLAMDEELAVWALEHGIPLINVFGSTEVGATMISYDKRRGVPGFLMKPLPGVRCEFHPVTWEDDHSTQLVELVIPPEAPECPHVSLRSTSDGKFHTGDLFEEVLPGSYVSRGRNDDWIKMENSLKCDSATITDKTLELCGKDLVESAVIIGTGRPSPVLVVEPRVATAGSEEESLKEKILERILPFSTLGYMHERISDVNHILVAPPGSLPRTAVKGNIKRTAVEQLYKEQLDKIFQ